ncbi:hypothetical protein [Paenibacillus silvae]|uniref:Uncharacterized protein n=1 Tax=Paenibacillus silvae TaxID=1325358 RepID=A0A2W6NDP8_9BACL|nr:hypothetical protein [Paenibacillus silvae]PZT54114.1 hypothetical protein DN757_18975 [Paenibacillus silvae]
MKKPIHKKWWFWLIIVIIAAGIFGDKDADNTKKNEVVSNEVSKPAEGKSETVVAEKPITKTQEVKVEKDVSKQEQEKIDIPGSLNMTPEEFRKSFNKRAQEIGNSKLKIGKKLEVQEGAVQDVFQYMITDYIGITGSINKADGSVRDVTMIGQGNGTITSGADIVLAMGLVILSVNPDVPASSVANILSDMHILDEGVDWATVDESTEVNGIRYNVMGSETIGIMFSASDANDK